MSARLMPHRIRWESWELSAAADRRFRRTLLLVGLPVLALAILVALWDLGTETRGGGEFNGTQYVQLLPEQAEIAEQAEEPKPAEEDKPAPPELAAPPKVVTPKPIAKPTPAVPAPPVETAREKAQKALAATGLDQLSDLRDSNVNPVISGQLQAPGVITSKGGLAGGGASSAEAVASSAAAGSGGIGSAGNGTVTTSQSGNGLGTRRTSTVKSPLGFGVDKSKQGQNGAAPAARTPSEIQAVFNKNQGPFYAIYNRAARENANIGRGKVVINLTIAPSGEVTACKVVSSSYNDPEFERKVVERVRLLNFGAKAVPVFTLDYPINFIPQ